MSDRHPIEGYNLGVNRIEVYRIGAKAWCGCEELVGASADERLPTMLRPRSSARVVPQHCPILSPGTFDCCPEG